MTAPASDTMQVTEFDGHVRISLPDAPTPLHFRSGRRRLDRFGAGISTFCLLSIIVTMVISAGALIPRLYRLFPLDRDLDWLELICGALFALMGAAMGFGFGSILVLAFFRRSVTIDVGVNQIVERVRHGPYRRTKRVHVRDIRRFIIKPFRGMTVAQSQEPPDRRPATVAAQIGEHPSEAVDFSVTLGHPAARQLAGSVAQALSKLLQRAGRWDVQKPSVVDAVDEAFLAAEQSQPPPWVRIQVKETATQRVITQLPPRPKLRDWLLLARLALLLCAPAMLLALPLLIPGLTLQTSQRVMILMCAPGFALAMTASVLVSTLSRREFRITADELQVISPRRRNWPRNRIAAIGVAYRAREGHGCRAVLELRDVDGKTHQLACGDVFTLRHLATLLRLAVPPPAPSPIQ